MIRRLGATLLCLAVLAAGCSKKEDTGQAKEAPAASGPAPTVAAGGTTAESPTKLGDPAYPLTGLTWVKAGPVSLSPGKVYVVEFWATWCPPCRASIPHLTQLQVKYVEKVTFVGISQEEVGVVKEFVGQQGDNMDYTVAVDVTGQVGKGYMEAFGQGGIPHAFVVDSQGKVVWHGHPMDSVDDVLDRVLAGTYEIPG